MRQRLRIDGGAVRQLQLREQPLQLQRHALLARPVPAGLVLPRIELPPELRGVVQRLQQRDHVAGRALVEEANVVAATLVEVGTAEFARQLADLAFHDGELVRVHKLQLPRLGTGLQPIEVGPRDGLQAVKAVMPTAAKKAWIKAEAEAGVPEIEVSIAWAWNKSRAIHD